MGVKQDRAGAAEANTRSRLSSEKRPTFLPIEILSSSLQFGRPKARPFGRDDPFRAREEYIPTCLPRGSGGVAGAGGV